jgi:hypothetical protein
MTCVSYTGPMHGHQETTKHNLLGRDIGKLLFLNSNLGVVRIMRACPHGAVFAAPSRFTLYHRLVLDVEKFLVLPEGTQ